MAKNDFVWTMSPLYDSAAVFDKKTNKITWVRFQNANPNVPWQSSKVFDSPIESICEEHTIVLACTSTHLIFGYQLWNGTIFFSARVYQIPWDRSQSWKSCDLIPASGTGYWNTAKFERAVCCPNPHRYWGKAYNYSSTLKWGVVFSKDRSIPVFDSGYIDNRLVVPHGTEFSTSFIYSDTEIFSLRENEDFLVLAHELAEGVITNAKVIRHGKWIATQKTGQNEKKTSVQCWYNESPWPEVKKHYAKIHEFSLFACEELIALSTYPLVDPLMGIPLCHGILWDKNIGRYSMILDPRGVGGREGIRVDLGDQWFGNHRLGNGMAFGDSKEKWIILSTNKWQNDSDHELIFAQETWFGLSFVCLKDEGKDSIIFRLPCLEKIKTLRSTIL